MSPTEMVVLQLITYGILGLIFGGAGYAIARFLKKKEEEGEKKDNGNA